MVTNLLNFISNLWHAIQAAMGLNPRVFEIVEAMPESRWVVLTIAILGGASLLLGQSAILFVNRVRPARFVLSLLFNGLMFVFNLVVWSLCIWFMSTYFWQGTAEYSTILRLVALGSAPYVFGFLILMPYLGNFVGHVLSVWSFLVVLAAGHYAYGLDYLDALVVVGLGWLLVVILGGTIGRPLAALRRAMVRWITGTNMDAQMHDILMDFVEGDPTKSPAKARTR